MRKMRLEFWQELGHAGLDGSMEDSSFVQQQWEIFAPLKERVMGAKPTRVDQECVGEVRGIPGGSAR